MCKYTSCRYMGAISGPTPVPSILFEDNQIIVVVKPPTMLTQGDETKDQHVLDWTKAYVADKYNKPGAVYLGLVHRVDRPCSGVLVFARTSKAAARLGASFKDREVEKKYVCVVHGKIEAPGECVNMLKATSYGSSSSSNALKNNNKVTVVDNARFQSLPAKIQANYVEARLSYRPLWSFLYPAQSTGSAGASSSYCTVVEVDLETGRKHQIRAQLAHLGHPICGDVKYGAPVWGAVAAAPATERVIGGNGEVVRISRGRGGKGRRRSDGSGSISGSGSVGENGSIDSNSISSAARGLVALHAYALTLPHPVSRLNMRFTADVPKMWGEHFGKEFIRKINKVTSTQ